MNSAQIHLMLNHLPVFGTLFATLILCGGWVLRNSTLKRLSLMVLVISGLAAVPVFFSGDGAEELVEHIAGVTETSIHQHESSARVALIGVETVAVLAALGLLLFRREPNMPRSFTLGVLLTAMVVSGVMAWTAHQGGLIRHPEITTTTLAPAAEGQD